MNLNGQKIVLAGGGTGGHLYPAIALADAVDRAAGTPVLVSGNRPIEQRVLGAIDYTVEQIGSRGFATSGVFGRVLAILSLVPAVVRSLGIIGRNRPVIVILTGGYIALPVGIAAILRGVPIALIEPNAIPGRATRILLRFCCAVVAPQGARIRIPEGTTLIHGAPVRQDIIDAGAGSKSGDQILILGGSQGAASLNGVVPEALAGQTSLPVLHVTGPGKLSEVEKHYARLNIQADVREYLDEMATELARTAFAIARAGAGTVAELIATHTPAVLVPYPYAADNHQLHNAKAFAELGGGCVVEEGADFAERLTESIAWMTRESRLDNCAASLKNSQSVFEPGEILSRMAATV